MRAQMIAALRVATLFLWTAAVALPQGIITTSAGTDFTFPFQPLSALNAPFGEAILGRFDARGNLYFADIEDSLVLKLDQQGSLRFVAGNGVQGFSGDGGPAMSASLFLPSGLAFDAFGNLFIPDGATTGSAR
jgi:hypothetical protein